MTWHGSGDGCIVTPDEVERPRAGVSSTSRAQHSEARSRRATTHASRSDPTDGQAPDWEIAHGRTLPVRRRRRVATAAVGLLDRRALHGPVGAKDTTVSRLRANQRVAADAFVKVDACVGWH
jgi:hypothetical protein